MARIELRNVNVDFPVYSVNSRSLKKQFLRLATGGTVTKGENQYIHIQALSNISLSLQHGDKVGLIGHNGAGKSTLLRLLAKIYEPTAGKCLIEGNVSPILNFIDGVENEFTGYENIMHRGIILGFTRKQIEKKIENIADLTGLGDYLHMPVRTYSTGMMVRLAFAVSTSIDPDIVLIDEVIGAGDAEFMKKAHEHLDSLLDQSSIVIIASHTNDLIRKFCNKAIVLEGGRVKYVGNVEDAIAISEIKNSHSA